MGSADGHVEKAENKASLDGRVGVGVDIVVREEEDVWPGTFLPSRRRTECSGLATFLRANFSRKAQPHLRSGGEPFDTY